MAVYKRGNIWWYKFFWNAEQVRESTKQSNKRLAEQMEATHKASLAKGEVGIREKKKVPSLGGFAPMFRDAIKVRCAAKPRTITFYEEKLERLLEYAPLERCKLDRIDEELIEAYIQERRKKVAPATVNRQLATLRRMLRLAYEWKILDRLPRIHLLAGERNREFVLSFELEKTYLEAAPQPLQDLAMLLLDTGLRVGEALNLDWPEVHLEPASGSKFGYIHIRDGKSRYAKRNVSLSSRVRAMLQKRANESKSPWVFPGKQGKPFLGTSVNHQHQEVRTALNLTKEFVIHSLRHTMLTRLGESGADAFTIMRIAGHSSVTTSQKYVHPSPESLERAFERLEALQVHRVGTDSGTPTPEAVGQGAVTVTK